MPGSVPRSRPGRLQMPERKSTIPRTIWFLWFQGLDKAPYVVRKCYESWVVRNPGWRIMLLDESTLPGFGTVNYSSDTVRAIPPTKRSDLVRLDLLAHHGGVWTDATCLCIRPLDDWLLPYMKSGFFAFSRPGPDRLLSSWFLAAEPGNILPTRLFSQLHSYWDSHIFRNEEREFTVNVLQRLLRGSARTRGWWFSRPVAEWLSVHPRNFVVHYAFEKLIREDPSCAEIWDRTPKVSAHPLHRPQLGGLLSPLSEELRSQIDRQDVPLYKTSWRVDDDKIPASSVLAYLLDMPPAEQP